MAKRGKIQVQHWMACLEAAVEPPASPNNLYNLSRVGYVYAAAADTEFPWAMSRLDMFARFFTQFRRMTTVEFEIRVGWVDAPNGLRIVETYGPFRVAFQAQVSVRDYAFQLRNVPIEGKGRYRIRLVEIYPRRGKLLATEYLTVVR
jgi:hypothetical protein